MTTKLSEFVRFQHKGLVAILNSVNEFNHNTKQIFMIAESIEEAKLVMIVDLWIRQGRCGAQQLFIREQQIIQQIEQTRPKVWCSKHQQRDNPQPSP